MLLTQEERIQLHEELARDALDDFEDVISGIADSGELPALSEIRFALNGQSPERIKLSWPERIRGLNDAKLMLLAKFIRPALRFGEELGSAFQCSALEATHG